MNAWNVGFCARCWPKFALGLFLIKRCSSWACFHGSLITWKTAQSSFTVIRELKRSDPETFAWNNGAERYKIYHSPSYISLSFPFNWILCLGMNLSRWISRPVMGRALQESINCELGLWNNEKEKKKKKKKKEKVYNCVGKTVHPARGVTMTGRSRFMSWWMSSPTPPLWLWLDCIGPGDTMRARECKLELRLCSGTRWTPASAIKQCPRCQVPHNHRQDWLEASA